MLLGGLARDSGFVVNILTLAVPGEFEASFPSSLYYISTFSRTKLGIPLYISELLYVSDCVIIPGLGGFVANSRSAFLNPAQHTFNPPVRRIAFNASLRTNDGLLANYVSRREGITYGDAVTKIKYFVILLLFTDIFDRKKCFVDRLCTLKLVFDKSGRGLCCDRRLEVVVESIRVCHRYFGSHLRWSLLV